MHLLHENPDLPCLQSIEILTYYDLMFTKYKPVSGKLLYRIMYRAQPWIA